MNRQKIFGHAVVMGAGMAGLITARVLADYYEKVTILEKETLLDEPVPRKYIPQGHHIHLVLSRGKDFIENCFPGIMDEIAQAGGHMVDASSDVSWFFQNTWRARQVSGVASLLSLRPYLEWHIRQRLLAGYPNVIIHENCEVTEFLMNENNTGIIGLNYLNASGDIKKILADLTVDCSGRKSKTSQWLENAGYNRPREEVVEINLGYASRIYKCPADFKEDWKLLALYPEIPKTWRAGVIAHVQDKQWIVTLVGYFGDHAPANENGFLEYARSLPRPDVYNQIKYAEPVSQIKVFKMPRIHWNHYEKLSRFPEGLIITGDAYCVFNPFFGQGITAITCYAGELRHCLQERALKGTDNMKGFPIAYHKRVAKQILLPWFLTNVIDLSYKQAKGKRPLGLPVLSWFLKKVIRGSACNSRINQAFLNVYHMNSGIEAFLKRSFLKPFLSYLIRDTFFPGQKRQE